MKVAKHACELGRSRYADNAEFWYASGNIASRAASIEVAELFYAKALYLRPDDAGYRIALCQQQLKLGDRESARASLTMNLADIRCFADLQRIKSLCAKLDDYGRVQECNDEITRLYYEATSRYDPDQPQD